MTAPSDRDLRATIAALLPALDRIALEVVERAVRGQVEVVERRAIVQRDWQPPTEAQ